MEHLTKKNSSIDLTKWREIVNDWEQSGESQKIYCGRIGVSLNTFVYARNKLLQKPKTKTTFAPLVIKNNEEANIASQIVLENNRGYKLHFPVSLSAEQIAKLFKLSGWYDA